MQRPITSDRTAITLSKARRAASNGLLFSVLCLLSSAAHGAAVQLSRAEASELYVALVTIDAGLSPGNTVTAADNVNALRPLVESLDKGKVAYNRAVAAVVRSKPADVDAQVEKLALELEAKADERFTVQLRPLNIADEEITAAKVKPATLAVLRRWLLNLKP